MSLAERVRGLKKGQLSDIMKQVKTALGINVTGASRDKLAETLLAIHGSPANKFKGKVLLGDSKEKAHILLPPRTAAGTEKRKAAIKKLKGQLKDIEVKQESVRKATKSGEAAKSAKVKKIEALQKRLQKATTMEEARKIQAEFNKLK